MKITNIVFFVLVLISCIPKPSERDKQVKEILKKDMEAKISQTISCNYYFQSEMNYPNKRERTKSWYYLQYDLMTYYNGLCIDTINPWVDSLNKRIVKMNDIFKDKIKNGDLTYFIPLLKSMKVKDTFDLLIIKNNYLSKIIDIQNLIAYQVYSGCFFDFKKYYINDYNSMKELYKTNDTLNAYFLPSMYLDEKTISEIKLYKDNKLIYKTNTKTENFNYSPLKAGKYTLKYAVFPIPAFGISINNALTERTYEFEVK